MPNAFQIDVDLSDFRQAIRRYAAYSRKTLPEIVTAKLGDLAYEAAKVVRRTTKEAVQSFADNKQKFWRYIAKVYDTVGLSVTRNRRAKGAEAFKPYKDLSTGKTITQRKWISERRTVGGANALTGLRDFNKRWREMQMIATRIMRRRKGRVKAFVGLFLHAAHLLGKGVARQAGIGKSGWRTRGVDSARAVPGSDRVEAFFTLPHRALLRETGEGNRALRENQKGAIAMAAINRAKARVIADMRQYVERKMAEGTRNLGRRAA